MGVEAVPVLTPRCNFHVSSVGRRRAADGSRLNQASPGSEAHRDCFLREANLSHKVFPTLLLSCLLRLTRAWCNFFKIKFKINT